MTVAAKKGRGRPPKKDKVSNDAEEDNIEEGTRMEKDEDGVSEKGEVEEEDVEMAANVSKKPAKGRGRPKKVEKQQLEDEILSENDDEKGDNSDSVTKRSIKSKKTYKEESDSGDESGAEEEDFDDEEENSGDDFDPKKSTKKKTPKKLKIKKSVGRGRPKKGEEKKAGRGRPPGAQGAAKKKATSPVHYLYDLSDSTDSDVDEGARSDASDDWNYRPYGDVRVKKRKQSRDHKDYESEEGDNWRPGKAFPGEKVKSSAKVKARKPSGDGRKKNRGRPPKAKVAKQDEDADEEKEDNDKNATKGTKNRGRPPKVKTAAEAVAPEDEGEKDEENIAENDE